MKSVKNLVVVISLFFASEVILHAINLTSSDGAAIILNLEIEEKSENSLEEEALRHASFNEKCLLNISAFQLHENFYSSTYTFSFDIPPEYC